MHRSDVDLLIASLEQHTVALHSRIFDTIPEVQSDTLCNIIMCHSISDD